MTSIADFGRPELIASHGVVIEAGVLDELHATSHRSLLRCGVFVVLYLATAWGVLVLQARPSTVGILLACVPLYLIAAASLHDLDRFVEPQHVCERGDVPTFR